MPRKILYSILVLVVVTACEGPLRGKLIPSQNPETAGTSTSDGTLTSGGLRRHYLLHVPPSYQQGESVPLVLNFHGLNSNSQQQEILTGMSAKADREGFLVVYPDGLNGQWNTGPTANGQADQQFIRDLILLLEGQYSIDPGRIYATGISNGGGMANRLGCDMADRIAAIAPDAGAYNFWQDCNPSRPVPVLAFHGLADNVIPYEGGTPKIMAPPIEEWASNWASLNTCSSPPGETNPVVTVTVYTWSGCQDNAEVSLYALEDHGHSWPGSAAMPPAITSQDVNATDVIWKFFKAHPMP